MAIGKLDEETDIDPARVRISFDDFPMYPEGPSDELLERAGQYLKNDEVIIKVDLGIDGGEFTVYGCDLTEGYVKINADYTT